MTPKKLFNFFAVAEAITWALLLFGMFLKYVTQSTEMGVRIGGGIHGFVFLCYVVVVIVVGVSQKWGGGRIGMGLVSAIVPFATIPFEIVTNRAGKLEGEWGLGRDGRTPSGPVEKLCARAIRSPLPAAGIGLLVVLVVFATLVTVGPPGK